MRYPAFVAEIAREEHRAKILTGVYTGYATTAILLAIVVVGTELGSLPPGPWAYALIGIKLATNTAAWWAWRTRVLYIELSALNILADVLAMTGAIYFTGGLLSPLVPIYFVEIAVMALLTNAGLTLLTTAGAFVMYAAMGLAIHAGVLPQLPSLLGVAEPPSTGLLVVLLSFAAAVMFGPAAYLSIMVDRLRRSERALERRATELIEASVPKIFEPYHQADGSLRREHGGAGIGLTVVRTLSDALGIEISVESEEGAGSAFTLRVPPSVSPI